jgi:hypothetical protein
MKCEIQWIDSTGKASPDSNKAIGIAVSTITVPGRVVNVQAFPICQEHATRMPKLVGRYKDHVSEWDFVAFNYH